MQAVSQIIYLASKSPRRRELLKQIGVRYELLMMREKGDRIDVDETPRADEPPRDYVERVVRLKAATAEGIQRERRLTARPILTADTTVALGNTILGKPENAQHAVSMLKSLSGQSHDVMTGIAVTWQGETQFLRSESQVTFAVLSADEIKRYVDSKEPMDKAGGYGIQGPAARFIKHLAGSYSGVMGLPLYETATLLRQCGIVV